MFVSGCDVDRLEIYIIIVLLYFGHFGYCFAFNNIILIAIIILIFTRTPSCSLCRCHYNLWFIKNIIKLIEKIGIICQKYNNKLKIVILHSFINLITL